MKFVKVISASEDEYEWGSDLNEELSWSDKNLVEVLNHYSTPFNTVRLGDTVFLIFEDQGKKYISSSFKEDVDYEDAEEWVDNLYDHELDSYAGETESDFWDGVPKSSGVYYYHGTKEERLNSIMKEGLLPKNESRGISNRGMGAGIFMSPEYETADYYYESVLQIDVGAMKADGYTPEVSGESPVDECEQRNVIAYKIGLENYFCVTDSSDGLAEDTIVIYQPIPPKYLKVM